MKINKTRIAVVIGKNGETKQSIERKLGVKIDLNSNTGDCDIRPDLTSNNYDPLNVLIAQKIVTAINRGFSPQKAFKLTEEEIDLEVINLIRVLGKSERKIKRMKGRVIGRGGEMRKAIEKYAECFLSVFGKTISIISDYENLKLARKALDMILNGTPHHTVLKYLESKFNERKKEEFRKMYKPQFD